MPKHRLTNEDMFKPKSCAICGNDVFDEETETCSWECDQQWQIFEDDFRKDYEEDIYNSILRDEAMLSNEHWDKEAK